MTWWQRIEKAAMSGFALLFVYLAFFEPPILTYSNIPFPILNADNTEPNAGAPLVKVKAGDAVHLKVTRCSSSRKERLYPVSHALVLRETDEKILLPATQAVIEPGCHTSVSAINVVPEGTLPGIYFVTGTAEVNGTIATHTIGWNSADFEVIK